MSVETAHAEKEFQALIQRVRVGDEDAARELVRVYEPHVRRAVRVRLHIPRLRQVVDSMDITQSVLGNFFVRAAAGQFEVDTPRQLVALLARMAENRVRDWQRRQTTLRRDKRREVSLSDLPVEPMAAPLSDEQPTEPARLLEEILECLNPQIRELVERRRRGESWDVIARDSDKSADALRMKLRRAMDRALGSLDLSN